MHEDTEIVLSMLVGLFAMVFVVAFAIGLAFVCILLIMKLSGLVVVSV